MIHRYQAYSKCQRAAKMLAEWKSFVPKFVKVMPQDYKRVLTSLKRSSRRA